MEPSAETENVLRYLDAAAGQGLRKRNDIGTLLELAWLRSAHQEINELAFHGSALYQVFMALRKSSPGAEGYRQLETEFRESVDRVRSLIARILVDSPADVIERFDQIYFKATQGSLRNLMDLGHDLGVLKSVQNEQKYGADRATEGSADS
jgi:hypothetical protein